MSTIKASGDALHTMLERVEGLRNHRYPKDSMSEFPCTVMFPQTITWTGSTTRGTIDFVNWNVDLLSNRQDLSGAAESLEPFLDALRNEIVKDFNLGGTIDHIGTDENVRCEIREFIIGDIKLIGYRITIPIKYHGTTIT